MAAIINKLKVERSEGMAGLGSDQGALRDKLEAEAADSSRFNPEKGEDQDEKGEIGHGKGQEIDRAPNTFGGPSYGRTSAIPRHESEALNKIDPRIGYDDDEVRQDELRRYEDKYGKPGDISDGHLRGRDMAGVGADQNALNEGP